MNIPLPFKKLPHAIILALGSAPLVSFSLPVFAGIKEATDMGMYHGNLLAITSLTPFKAFADYGALNQGWTHSAQFLTLTIGTDQDITNGKTFDVQLTMAGQGNLANVGAAAIDNPAFALWTAGTGKLSPSLAFGQHGWNPTRGPNETGINIDGAVDRLNTNETFRRVGVLDGHMGWIGYVNAGPTYTLENRVDPLAGDSQTVSGKSVFDTVSHGELNTSSKTWLTNPEASSTAFTANYTLRGETMTGTVPDASSMTLYGLKAGHYLIATGGSCATTPTPKTLCGIGTQFTFTVQPIPPLVDGNNAQYDPVTQTLIIHDVQVQNQHYQVQLQLQPNSIFNLVKSQAVISPLQSQPAQYDLKIARLTIPRVQVMGKYYSVFLRNLGDYHFILDQMTEIP